MYCSPNIVRVIKSRRMRWAGYVARMGRGEAYAGFWWGEPVGKRPLGRLRPRWQYNIKIDFQEVRCGVYGLDRAGSGYGQVVGTCECGNEQQRIFVHYAYSRTQLYFTQKYSRYTNTCFGPICWPSSCCDLTYTAAIQDVWCVFQGIGGWVGGTRSRCFNSGYHDLGLL